MNNTLTTSRISSSLLLWCWLLVGTLDLSAATIQTLIAGSTPTRLCQFVASGFFGQEAFTSPVYAFWGIAFHYLIALCWTLLFFILSTGFALYRFNALVVGVAYGIMIWLIMNRIVLPFSNITPRPFDLVRASIGASILIVAIGIPLAIIVSRSLRRRS